MRSAHLAKSKSVYNVGGHFLWSQNSCNPEKLPRLSREPRDILPRMAVRIIFCCIAALTLSACGKKGMSDAGYIASQRAIDAIARAYEYRDNFPVYYEPRLLDAQRAISDIPVLKNDGPEFLFKMEATTCTNILSLYRTHMQIDEHNLGKTGADAIASDPEMNDIYYRVTKCVRGLSSVLSKLNSQDQ